MTLTYAPDCPGCIEKKRIGKRTGLEPTPLQYGKQKKLTTEQYTANMIRLRKGAVNRRKYYEGLLARNIVS
jgi:hypothetical protein